ncbi:non-ribosomal peptide synthetase [Nocardia seriolae]|uniref:non-ribosomal peptide synthetase n=1 Tax=Nocardia seriolae TaxID=37332 RepID=UPI0008FF5D80|nr:non-ribosomal peptide synthetase [Nocardia seriolae]PSK29589.1 non-ribosomal peptide synthetase [Nocardia seriolae]QOW35782.1 amino acid adenylation domain-containing protein [Nocardia seriolae]QUN16727.1 amino acid adenylation domain-containing protein [Nocardia seriolae]WNJ56183.1 amino acid adenylation domain-containing protein [Nocardia seriolae]
MTASAPATRHSRRARGRGTRIRTLPQLLSAAVEANPDGIALWYAGEALTYAELYRRSSRLARVLIGRGLGPEDRVVVALPRSIDAMVAVWAVAKSGAVYVPVDPNYPAERVRYMLADSNAALAISRTGWHSEWNKDRLDIDSPECAAALANVSDRPVSYIERVRLLHGDNAAYVIYTSGSTGKPKGVTVAHAGIAGLCAEISRRFDVTRDARTLHFVSPSFDAAVLELLLARGVGATMVIAPADIYGGDELTELLRAQRVTHAFLTPAVLAGIDPSRLPELRVLLVGGEASPPELVARWSQDRAFFNLYGPTESTVAVTMSDPLTAADTVTVGAPIPGVTALVLDARLRLVPDGAAGELYIAAAGLARGYHDRPALTADRFVAYPGGIGERMYRTGDVVRWVTGKPGGRELEYLGRSDSQVKVRGFRVELGEIDAALAADDSVALAITTARSLANGETALVSYVLPRTGAEPDAVALRERARATLPRHAVPAAIVVIDEVPLTPAGKLDRERLPEPVLGGREYRAPAGAAEVLIAEEFERLLGIQRVGATDDFFELGGNSLLAMRLLGRLSAAFGIKISVETVFDHPTVAALAAVLSVRSGAAVRSGARAECAPPVPQARGDRSPLSLAQQRMWFLARLDPESAAHHIPIALRLSGALDVAALAAAVRDVVERHEVLRTVYPEIDGVGYQLVLAAERVPLDLTPRPVDASELPGELAALASRGFDVTREVALRAGLFQVADREFVLAVVVHHIAAEGFSLDPLTRDLTVAYLARTQGHPPAWTPLPVQYADYAIWQRELLGSGDDPDSLLSRQLRYWRDTLAGLPPLLDLPTDRPRPAVLATAGAAYGFEIDGELRAGLERLARDRGASLFMVVHAALAVVLARLARTDDIAIGTPLAGRGARELDDLIGMFVNTLVLRTGIDAAEPFARLLDRVRETDLAAFDHADVPFECLVEALDPPRTEAYQPLVQVLLIFQNLGEQALALPDLTIAGVESECDIAEFDLELTVVEQPGGGLHCCWRYATDLFDQTRMAALARQLNRVLAAAVADPDLPVGDLPLLTAAERAALTVAGSGARQPVSPGTLLDPFHAWAARTSDAVAVVSDDRSYTYAEFAAWVNRLARELISYGVGPETRVAVAIPRSPEMLAAIYAVLTAGGAYVPIDPDHPAERIRHILDTVRPVCVLTAGTRIDTAAMPEVSLEWLDLSAHPTDPVTDAERRAPLRLSNAAYVLFTSGSTGRPKGVVVTQAAVVNQMAWMRGQYDLRPADAFLHKTPVTFDASVWELFLPLRIGARLVVARPGGHLEPDYLLATARRHDVAMLEFVPSMLAVLLADPNAELPGGVRYLSVGGEELPPGLVAQVRERHPAVVDNTYGPTEATVTSTFHRCAPADGNRVPIGRPVPNTGVRVLDSRLHPVPTGIPGELYLTGSQLARGYEATGGQTAHRFVADPDGPAGTRMYRTGDLVVMRADGALEFLGRTDFQLSLHGLRIEPGEVEAALRAHPAVDRATVVLRREQLIGYVTAAGEDRPDVEAVLATARDRLPGYMVPAQVVLLDELPLGATGKLDRAALPEPVLPAREFRPPVTVDEYGVAAVFSEILGIDRVGRDDDFFALGGTSLTTIRVRAALAEKLELPVPLRLLFAHPGVGDLAAALRDEPAAATTGPDPRADAVLDAAITASGCIPARSGAPQTVLLTGATGFLGVFLLRELLEHTSATIYCLVRAGSDAAARERIRTAAQRYRLDLGAHADRIVAVAGDLAQPQLGLSAEHFAELAERIEVVCHNGALVNHLEPYARMRDANVGGTAEVLRLAATTRVKPVHYVSTASLAAATAGEPPSGVPGYVLSKWVAEQLVAAAPDRGIPAVIHRPGLIAGDTRTGAGSTDDAVWTMVRAMVILGMAPELGDVAIEVHPVNHVAAAITGPLRHSGGAAVESGPYRVSLRDLIDRLIGRGHRLRPVDPEGFGAALAAAAEQAAAAGDHTLARAAALSINFTGFGAVAEGETGQRCPTLDGDVLDRYLDYFTDIGFLPCPGARDASIPSTGAQFA